MVATRSGVPTMEWAITSVVSTPVAVTIGGTTQAAGPAIRPSIASNARLITPVSRADSVP